MSADRASDEGQPAALLALVQEHAPAVLALCLVYVRNRDEAEDLVQETLLKATASIRNCVSRRPCRHGSCRSPAGAA